MRRNHLTLLLGFLPLAFAPSAHAGDEGRNIYHAAFYGEIAPHNALDMIRQTPGFTLQEGDNRRGYAGSLGNVLVDGRRAVGKDQTLQDVLQRIPASQVLRIEILSGGDVAGDASGQSVLANVVRVTSAGQGYASAGVEYANRNRAVPNGYITWSGRYRDTSYNLGGSTYALVRDLPGAYANYDGDGKLISTGYESSPRHYYEYAVNGEASRPLWGGELNITGQTKYARYQENPRLETIETSGAKITTETPYMETTETAELGSHYDRGIGPWILSLVGLATHKHFYSDVSATQIEAGSRFHQDLDHRSAENIMRASLGRNLATDHRVEFGAEHAENSLTAALNLTFNQGGVTYPIAVPDSNSTIRESRDDIYATWIWQIDPKLSSEVRLAQEQSDLRFTGDTNKGVTYRFFKPAFTLTRKYGDNNQLVLRLYRDIGQIDFEDFVSAASLKDSVINGGNPDLRPQTAWRTELTNDIHFSAKTTLSLKVWHSVLQDAADLVPVYKDGTAYDAPGNISKGTITGLSASLHLPLDRLIPGGSLQIDTMNQITRLIDPVTHQPRIISNLATSTHMVSFRQDLPKRHMAWGIDYSDVSALTQFRLNETDTTQAAPVMNLFIERNNLGAYSLKATLNAANNAPALRRRVFYANDRNGHFERIETQKHLSDVWFNLALSRAF